MTELKQLKDYTKDERAKFDKMHTVLSEYNRKVQSRQGKPLDTPPFTDHEMFMYSRYRELVIAAECEDDE